MIEAKTRSAKRRTASNKSLVVGLILIILVVLGLYGFNAFRAFQAASQQKGNIPITQSQLAEDYGLRVQLLAVTAAGGMVDLRLQIVDAAKAKALLKYPVNFPVLHAGKDIVLRTSEDVATQEIQFENGKSIFVLFPNAKGSLKPGDSVDIVFGALQLETIQSQ